MFQLKANGTDVKTEVISGFTTFLTMVYIVVVNPAILSAAGVPFNTVFMATIISAVIGTLWMAIFANYPIAIAPGLGMNAYFVTVVTTTKTRLFGRIRCGLCSRYYFLIIIFNTAS